MFSFRRPFLSRALCFIYIGAAAHSFGDRRSSRSGHEAQAEVLRGAASCTLKASHVYACKRDRCGFPFTDQASSEITAIQ